MPEAAPAEPAQNAIPVFASQREADEAPGGTPAVYEIRDPAVEALQKTAAAMLPAKLDDAHAEILRLREQLSRARPALLSKEEDEAARKAVPPARRFKNMERETRTFIDANGRICRMLPNKILDERYFPIEFIAQQGFDLKEVGPEVRQIGRFSFQSPVH
jgi:hypothetical protein